MDGENTSYDNAHANTRQEDNTPKALRRDDNTKTETTRTMEKRHTELQGKQKHEEKTTPNVKEGEANQNMRSSRNKHT